MSNLTTDEYGNTYDAQGNPVDADGNPIGSGIGQASAAELAAARRAAEDTPYDEYGIEKPHVSHTQRWGDYVAPPEVMGDPDTSEAEKVARSVVAPVASLYGHFADQFPMPLLGEIAHQNEIKHYEEQRAAAQAAEEEARYQRELAEWERDQAEYERQLAEAQAQYAPEQATPQAEHERQVAEAQSWYAADQAGEAPAEASASY